MALVSVASKIEVCGSPTMSEERSGSRCTKNTLEAHPLGGGLDSSLNGLATETSFFAMKVRSVREAESR